MIKSILSDMDGVIYRGKQLIPGAKDFVERLLMKNTPFQFLTNASEKTPLELLQKLEGMGINGLTEDNFITCAMATAAFIASQMQNATAYVIGGKGLYLALEKAGIRITENNPDYVIVGFTKEFNYDMLKTAVNLIDKGARFIGTNPDASDPAEEGLIPACGSILASIETGSGRKPYIIGKPNALMMMTARKRLGAHSSETVMIGDRMDTDILSGLEAGMTTCLVLSGVSTLETLKQYPFRPNYVFNHVGEIDPAKL